ncbi:MAG: DUF1289 domain-containing protein [Porticoccaceae bacterium]|nr:DUF1289 domain-containing protein [Porticoccaceae bacterium]
MKRQKSPCIDVCKFNGPRGWCMGCGRTREECKSWKSMKPYAIKKLQKELSNRLVQISRLNE